MNIKPDVLACSFMGYLFIFNYCFFFFNVHLFLREKERERERENSGGWAERESETQYLKQAAGSELSAQSDMELESTNCEINDLSQGWKLNQLSQSGAPNYWFLPSG